MSVYKAGHVGGINVSGVTAQGQWFIVSEDLLCKYWVKYPPTTYYAKPEGLRH